MRNCPKCGRGQLSFDRAPNRYKIIYYCSRCGEETVVHVSQEEIEREEREEALKRYNDYKNDCECRRQERFWENLY